MVSLAFGEKLQRKQPLRNPKLSPEQREFDGEFVLFVKYSAWRILSENNKVICTSDDSNEAGGPMLSGLHRLIGSYVSSINVANDNGGLDLFFGDGLCIQLKCVDCINTLDSYSLLYLGRTIADVGCTIFPSGAPSAS
ncbi:hypothetical protein [Ralstonia pseudosolanacearum]|uniref:hypothetical protein n=1 Tax=Ralstonia pseudosolanacearum TaxID=1310165 RepID=UPI001FFBDE17|nr:hypothetical protein [Ralstonia pseudosolanacearum]